jgi:hypothetical protein
MKKRFTYNAIVCGCKAFLDYLNVIFFGVMTSIGLFLLFLAGIVGAALSARAFIPEDMIPFFMQIFTILGIALSIIAAGWLTLALDKLYLLIVDGNTVHVRAMFSLTLRQIISGIGAWVLYNGIGFIGIICGVIPGIIWFMRAAFYPWLVIEKNMGAIASLKESFKISSGHNGQLFGLLVVTSLLACIPVIGSVIGALAYVYVYKKVL